MSQSGNNVEQAEEEQRPAMQQHSSGSSLQSPMRHHQRGQSNPRQVKETLNARSEYLNGDAEGHSQHRINQYTIKQEIGRGSFGAVHLAIDQFGNEYAVKEFSKSRLRKRAQSNILRRPVGPQKRAAGVGAGLGLDSPLFRRDNNDGLQAGSSLALIQEEIAIMKKLNHDNLVSLIEVLDDPEEDSLYMVLEMCKKGVIMKVGFEEKSEGYDAESCRCWFRDLLLGLEYLHAQGIVHRDIKPDNCLLTKDDVLKLSDFGVSEMFAKESEMVTAKSAGSPAFLPPELCVAKHGDISGKAADIWGIGATLYCLRFGKIPFEKINILDLYESIRSDQLSLPEETESEFVDLLQRTLEKDPSKRLTMEELKTHPWVTNKGSDPLLSTEENTADLISPPTEDEVNSAITTTLGDLVTVMKAVQKFKSLIGKPTSAGAGSPAAETPDSNTGAPHSKEHAADKSSTGSGRHISLGDVRQNLPSSVKGGLSHMFGKGKSDQPKPLSSTTTEVPFPNRPLGKRHTAPASQGFGKGQAHDIDSDAPLDLDIGPGATSNDDEALYGQRGLHYVFSESPPGTDENIYARAYEEEIKRIRHAQGHRATVYLTRRVDQVVDLVQQTSGAAPATAGAVLAGIKGAMSEGPGARAGWAKLMERSKAKGKVDET